MFWHLLVLGGIGILEVTVNGPTELEPKVPVLRGQTEFDAVEAVPPHLFFLKALKSKGGILSSTAIFFLC